jgi:enolase-phosphatase E1
VFRSELHPVHDAVDAFRRRRVIAALPPQIRVVLLDIEGTTTPIAFVHETLFPFARTHLAGFLAGHWTSPAVQQIVERLEKEHESDGAAAPAWRNEDDGMRRASATSYALWLMDRDRKSPGLKELQGLIWEDGYRAGDLHGVVWNDVPAAIRRWRDRGIAVAIYSSGSELAQRLLFQSTGHGDLTPLISAFFDTRVGGKLLAQSYGRIAAALGVEPREICFVSDVTGELHAARSAGCVPVLSRRPGNPPQADADEFRSVRTFDEL